MITLLVLQESEPGTITQETKMKITAASTSYIQEQNEPSTPFLITLEIEEISRTAIEKALKAGYDAIDFLWSGHWADLQAEDEDGTTLFFGFGKEHKDALGLSD